MNDNDLVNARVGTALLGGVLAGMGLGSVLVLNKIIGLSLAIISLGLIILAGLVIKRKEEDLAQKRAWSKDTMGVSPVIAVILMVAITVVLAATVFVLVSDIGGTNQPAPSMSFDRDNTTKELLLTAVSRNDLQWASFTVNGCTAPTGVVDAGDKLTSCAGDVTIIYKPSNSIVYRGKF